MHLPIRSRVNAGLALGVAALALILLFTRSGVSDLIVSRRDIARAEELVMAVERAFSLAKDAETGGRGYVITGRRRSSRRSRWRRSRCRRRSTTCAA